MRRFYVVSSEGAITGEGVAFVGEGNALRWIATNGLVRLQIGRVYAVSSSELDEMLAEMHMHIYWLDGIDVPVPTQGALT